MELVKIFLERAHLLKHIQTILSSTTLTMYLDNGMKTKQVFTHSMVISMLGRLTSLKWFGKIPVRLVVASQVTMLSVATHLKETLAVNSAIM